MEYRGTCGRGWWTQKFSYLPLEWALPHIYFYALTVAKTLAYFQIEQFLGDRLTGWQKTCKQDKRLNIAVRW
jgi:hypothetical protein